MSSGLKRFEIYRTNCRGIGGLVDFLGEIEAEDEEEAEREARGIFDFTSAEGSHILEVDVTGREPTP